MKKLLFTLLFSTLLSAAEASQLPGEPMNHLDGTPFSFSSLQGKVVILNFWATWCPPCRREMPTFIELQQNYAPQGVQFIGVAIDNPRLAQRYGEEHGINFPLLQGEESGLELSMRLGNRRSILPYTVIFDRNGKVLARRNGEIQRQQIVDTITPAL